MALNIHVATKTSIGRVRSRNEDAFLVADLDSGALELERGGARLTVGARGVLLAVSDGMGGHKAGDVAAAMTLDTLYRYLVERASKSEIDARLVSATETANAEVYEAGLRPSLEKMGATVTAVLLEGTRAYVAEVGDSRGYVLRDGVVHRLTLDQSFAQVALSAGALRPEEVATSPLRNLLVQAIGQTPDVSVALTALDLRQRDCLILASDGLTSKLSDEEIAGVILSSASLEQACARLVEIANGRGGEDNITVVLAGISAGAPEGTRDERFSGTFRVLREYRPAGHEGHAQ